MEDQLVIRVATIFFLAGLVAGCVSNAATTSAPVGPDDDPYFLCHASADYVRHHIDVCSGILK
jgi:hypothetical protein